MFPRGIRTCSPGGRYLGSLLLAFSLGFLLCLFSIQLSASPATAWTNLITPLSLAPSRDRDGHSIIPPILHFVQLKPQADTPLHFSFEAFLALYSAYLSVRPSAIYIHIDYTPTDIAHARTHGSSWTKKILSPDLFPRPASSSTTITTNIIHLNHITAPTHTGPENLPIARIEHKSDFVRLDQLALLGGGVYLDWDVVTLRPLAPLLRAGFRAVVGRQPDAFVNNGILLAAPGSAVLEAMRREAPRVFDGGWITHSVRLLTRVVAAVAGAGDDEVLVMDHKAFSPFSWEQASVDALLARHEGEAVPVEELEGTSVRSGERGRGRREWEYDFSEAYFLHKFFNDVENPRGYNGGVTVPYILARDSNYALAVWPVVREGIRTGYIDEHDTTA